MDCDILFVDSIHMKKSRFKSKVMLLNNIPGREFTPAFWHGWLLGETPTRVTCELVTGAIGIGETPDGRALSFFDHEIYVEDKDEFYWNTAANRVSFYLNADCIPMVPPFFLSTNPALQPKQYQVEVALSFETLDYLPEVAANSAFSDWLENATSDPPGIFQRLFNRNKPINKPSLGDRYFQEFRAFQPIPGSAYPVSVILEGQEVHGALILTGPIGPCRFLADLHLSDTVVPLTAGSVLFREIIWTEPRNRSGKGEKETKRFYKEIGVIEAIRTPPNKV